MDADEDTITLEPHCGRDIGPCRDVYMPALSGWNRYLTSQRTKMAYAHKKSGGIGYEVIIHAHHQIIVWNNDKVCCPSLPQPDGFGWENKEDKWIPVMTNEASAPEAIIQLVKCNC